MTESSIWREGWDHESRYFGFCFSPKDWELGVAVCFPTQGSALPGVVTVRGWALHLYVGPFSVSLYDGRDCDVEL